MEEMYVNEENEEVLENTASSIPEELNKYLEKDEFTLGKIEEVLSDLDDRMDALNNEKEESEKSFDDRLEEFKEMLAKEKEDAFNEFARREQELDAEKNRIEGIKLEEQGNQVNYIDVLKEISDNYGSKINSIEEAIKACEDNETLTKALEEEKEKLEEALNSEYETRKENLDKVLVDIGFEAEPKVEEKEEVKNDPNLEINLDFRTPEEIELDRIKEETRINMDVLSSLNMSDDNEVVEHEARPDVIKDIYESEAIMEGNVFPYLRSLRD